MSEGYASTRGQDEPGLYEIRVKGHLDDRWAGWFGGLALKRDDDGDTLLSGLVIDQAALHGLLRKVRDLGLVLISVIHIEPDGQTDRTSNPDPNPTPSDEETNP